MRSNRSAGGCVGLRRSALMLAVLLGSACATQPTRISVAPSAITVPAGVIAMNVTVNERGGSCNREADQCPIGAALEHLLFRGIPGSAQPGPLIPDERGARNKHSKFIDGLIAGEAGRGFVVSVTSTQREPESFVISIHHSRLRDALVREGIIRRFGY